MACCPAHADSNPSLSITVAEDGKILLHCFAGCATEAVMQAIGLEMSVLAAPAFGAHAQRDVRPSANKHGWQAIQDAIAFIARKANASVDAIHEYPGVDGIMQFAIVRLKTPNDKTFRALHQRDGRWHFGDPDRLLPLFHLPRILRSAEVLVVEGEKCALQAEAFGVVATTSSHGANAAKKTDWNYAANKTVTIWPDNDEAGRNYAADVIRILRTINPEVPIRIVSVTDLPDGGDIVDWVEIQKERGLDDDEIAALLGQVLHDATPVPTGNNTYSTYSTGESPGFGDWPTPRPLPTSATPTPFPLHEAFPPMCEKLRVYIAAVAHSYQVPIDLPALLALAAFALTVARTFEVIAQKDWKEVLSIYVLALLPSGERKSAVFAKMIDPIYAWQEVQAGAMANDLNSHKNEVDVLKEKVRRAKKKTAQAGDDESDGTLDDLTRELAELERAAPRPPSLVASEATTESIADMLVENGERGMLAAPEGDAIDVLLGRYGQGKPNFGLWLNGHSGDAVTIRRKGRTTLSLRRPSLCVALTVQPVAAQELVQSPQADGRGVLARFLYAYPIPMVGHREMEPAPVPTELTDWYGARLHELLDRPVPHEPSYLNITPKAKALLLAFREQVEVDLREGGALHDRQSWGSKLPGAILRIAGILHIVGNRGPGNGLIDDLTMKAALAWAPYLCDHQRRATSLGAGDAVVGLARRILSWLGRTQRSEFDHNQCFNCVRGASVQKATDIDSALQLLEDYGWIRPAPAKPRPPGTRGRLPSPRYLVNPVAGNPGTGPQNTHNTRNSSDAAPDQTTDTGGGS